MESEHIESLDDVPAENHIKSSTARVTFSDGVLSIPCDVLSPFTVFRNALELDRHVGDNKEPQIVIRDLNTMDWRAIEPYLLRYTGPKARTPRYPPHVCKHPKGHLVVTGAIPHTDLTRLIRCTDDRTWVSNLWTHRTQFYRVLHAASRYDCPHLVAIMVTFLATKTRGLPVGLAAQQLSIPNNCQLNA